ncbi:MAG: carboxymuconolactone decarboxylase family protein [Pseudomonadota bacterium]
MTEDRIAAGERVMEELLGAVPETTEHFKELMAVTKAQVFGEIWTRPALSWRDRELITIAILAEQGGRERQLRVHLKAALRVGLTPDELKETMIQIACYSGYPAAFSSMSVLAEVLNEQAVDEIDVEPDADAAPEAR